jgi:hypothetical protein
MPNISHIPPSRVVGLAFEPREKCEVFPEFLAYAQKYIGRYFIGRADGLPAPFESHYSYMWHAWLSNPLSMVPRKGVSMMLSMMTSLEGHKYRWTLARAILHHNLPVDMWGSGVDYLRREVGPRPQLKGGFENSLTTLHNNYQYSIVIENTRSESYVSEKFNDCMITGIIPVYMGASRVRSIYNPTVCLDLTYNLENDLQLIRSLCYDNHPVDWDQIRKNRECMETSPETNMFEAIKQKKFFLEDVQECA